MNNKELSEAPLGYWEKSSYMKIILEPENSNLNANEIVERIRKVEGIEVKDNHIDPQYGVLYVNLNYENEDYEVGIYPDNFKFLPMYINSSDNLSDLEIKKLKIANKVLTIFMNFSKNIKKSFHLQIKIILGIYPNLIAVEDESAERILSSKWIKLIANSKTLPAPTCLFNVQAVEGENNTIWLHTHGLCRCKITELEILNSNKEHYKVHHNLINAYASYLIDKFGEIDPRKESTYLGILSNKMPLIITCKSWTEAIYEYDNLLIGGLKDRQRSHNTKTSPIFVYKTKEDEEKGLLSKVNDYDSIWNDNTIFYFSDEETKRMKKAAIERFDYIRKALNNKENKVIIKIGLKCDNGEGMEHIWFELLEINNDLLKVKLIQEPYNISNIKIGDEKTYSKEDITDWLIFTPKFNITPDNVYLLD